MFELRTSERTTFKRCPQRWWWSYEENLVSNRNKPALMFGTAVHEALAEWYQTGLTRGAHPAETILMHLDEIRKVFVVDDESAGKWADSRILGEQMMERYVDFYGEDESWNVIATEQTFQVWIPHPSGRAGRWLRYVGTADGVYRDLETGEIWLMEHKTAASIQINHLPLDDQAGSYWAVMNGKLRRMGVLGPRESIAGIRYNFLRKALNDERPKNDLGQFTNKPVKANYLETFGPGITVIPSVRKGELIPIDKATMEDLETFAREEGFYVVGDPSKSQPPPYFERVPVYRTINARKRMIGRIQDEALHMEAIRSGQLPLFKVPSQSGYLACTGCEFFQLCKMHEEGSEFFEDYKEAEFHTRDPYEDHRDRKSASA